MLVPLSRATGNQSHLFVRSVLSSAPPQPPRLFKSAKPTMSRWPLTHSVPGPIRNIGRPTPKLNHPASGGSVFGTFCLLGASHADRLAGSAALHYLLSRKLSSAREKTSKATTTITPMTGPSGAYARSFESDFLKIGFVKTLENENEIEFSDGNIAIALYSVLTPTSLWIAIKLDEKSTINEKPGSKQLLSLHFVSDRPKAWKNHSTEWNRILKLINECVERHPPKQLVEEPIEEPYNQIIKSIQPEFEKISFPKIQEDQHSVTFSDGTINLSLYSERFIYQSLDMVLTDKDDIVLIPPKVLWAELYSAGKWKDWHHALKKHGLGEGDKTPEAVEEENYRLGWLLKLKKMANFLEMHKKSLVKTVVRTQY